MINLDTYLRSDATALAALVQQGETDADELLALATQRHEQVDSEIHAVVEWYSDPDEPWIDDDQKLPGIPFLRKDYGSAEAGRLVEMGSRLAAGYRSPTTSPFYDRLRTAGVQVVGRSAVPEFIQHGTTESVAFGTTCNPWDSTLSAGGSSGGAAAAVAAGVVPAAHASDCAGSIRIPAAACGLFGLKPSRRRVPWPDGGWGGIAEEFVVTRSIRDCKLFLDVLGVGLYQPVKESMRIALSTEHWAGSAPDGRVIEATELAAAALRADGHDVVHVPAPVLDERLRTVWDPLFTRWVAHDVRNMAQHTRRPVDDSTLEPTTLLAVESGEWLSAADVTSAQIEQGRITHDLHSALAEFDAILTPTLGRDRIPLDWVGGDVEPIETYLQRNSELFPYSFLFNLTGWASLAVPLASPGEALPGSIQLSGPIGSEHRLLALGETISPGIRPPA